MGFSIYNIYNRKNAASINFRQNENTGANEGKTSIFELYQQLVIISNSKNMKKDNLIIALFSLLFLASCEEVVQLDLNNAPPKIVIEANIKWQKALVVMCKE
jgi:hypothetical protein